MSKSFMKQNDNDHCHSIVETINFTFYSNSKILLRISLLLIGTFMHMNSSIFFKHSNSIGMVMSTTDKSCQNMSNWLFRIELE